MRVLYVASEIFPFVKTGGLADVAGSLPKALLSTGVEVRVLVPGFDAILKNLENIKIVRTLSPFFRQKDAKLLLGDLDGIKTYVLDCPGFYDRTGPYGDEEHKDWPDNHLRFAALSRVGADLSLYDPDWQPEIVHGNDWQCGLLPVYLSLRGRDRPKSVITIHNLAYQGLFPSSILNEINLPEELYTPEGFEFYNKIGFLKAGLQYADKITTVSPTYAREIQEKEQGCGLDGLLDKRSQDVIGILNGIDNSIWNPEQDICIAQKYNSKSIKNKTKNRSALLNELGLSTQTDLPVFGVISRLVSQKGLDLLLKSMPELLKMGAVFVILGSGDVQLEKQFQKLALSWPAQVYLSTAYDEALAHRIIAGADAVIIPSRFEPCGLVQMYAMKYGTLPIVRKTGGLADSVIEDNAHSTGFVFNAATVQDLSDALIRTCALYRAPALWKKRQVKAMLQNFGWEISADKYIQLYRALVS